MLWRLLAYGQGATLATPVQPARETTRYSLTSTTQPDIHDPTAWRLLASNDGGATWKILDIRTNQHFVARSQRVTFYIANRRPYSTYRLQIDAVNSTDVSLDMSVQLAGFDLVGPLVNVPDESKLQTMITASCPHPVVGPAEFAFDNDPTTAWCDYGFGSPAGCWLQVHYTLNSVVLVTNLSQATLLTHVLAARAKLADGGARVLSNLAANVVAPRPLAGYALTSANDEPERDPRDWELLGSDDNGKTWTVVDRRINEIFHDRFERRVFALTNAASFRLFRMQIDACMASNSICQIAEIEPLYADSQTDDKYSMVVSSVADNPPLESTEMAFDGDPRSKWLCFVAPAPSAPIWIQWQLTPSEADLPVINQRQLDILSHDLAIRQVLAETNPVKVSIAGYALTSANDYAARDPCAWRLLGSNDGGQSWDLLDRREHEAFSERLQRRVFPLAHPAAYQTFRLQIESVFSPTNANSVQLAEIEPLLADPQAAGSLTVLASSQGENAPVETVDLLFDGNPKTKWLDYSASSSNHSSWVEWHFVKEPVRRAVDMDREQAARSLTPDVFEIRLAATVLFADQARATAGLGDETGFQWIHLDPWPDVVVPGGHLVLTGQLKIKGGSLFVSAARAVTVRGSPGWDAARTAPMYSPGSVVGRISGIFSGPAYCGATLTLSNGSSFEARLPGPRFPVPPDIACPVRVDGVIEDLMASHDRRIPSVIWAARPEAVALAPETDDDWNRLADFSPTMPLPAATRLPGTWQPAALPGSGFISVGTNVIATTALAAPALSAGAAVEAAGVLTSEGRQLVLRNSCLRPVPPPAATASPLLTRISEIQQFINRNPASNAAVRIHGVLTYIDLNMGGFYIQDGAEGLQVLGQMNAGLCPKLSDEGEYVELEGQATAGSVFATAFVHVLGPGRLPEPAHPSWDNLISGAMDNCWVEVDGVITATEKQRFTLSTAGGRLIVWINELDQATADSWSGSLVRVRGVCSPVVNARNQRLGVRLLVPGSECVELLSLAPEKPFDLPLLPMASVMSADSSVSDPQQRYARTRGVITYKQGRLLFLQDGTDGLRVTLRDDLNARPGDVVEVVGRPQPDGFSAKLVQAVARIMGHSSIPAAAPIDLANVNLGDLVQQKDASRVELAGVLLNESADATGRTLNLREEQTRQVFSAHLSADDSTKPLIPEGSRLRIRGVFKAVQDKTPDVDQAATTFEVYVNSPDDLTVLARPSWWTARHTFELTGVFAGILAISLAWIWLLRNQVRQRTSDLALKVEELKRSEASLATEVSERKRLQADAERAHQQLLTVARQAGMAEVATGILHNVGNVLNSVNVSSTVVMDRLRNTRIEGVEKAVALLRQNETELAAYLQTEKGRSVLSYLEQLASHLTANHAGTIEELKDLNKNIQHIKDIVAVQQDYARFSGFIEKLRIIDLIEDALRMTASSRAERISIERAFDPGTPLVEADRHKVLQILVNLLNNAQQACGESGHPDKRISLAVRRGEGSIQICVTDNGMGIAPENLERVFNHGFTTRKHGHGFGLHNAALAAREMGGALRVASPGPGRGATFTLELPLSR